MANVFLLILQVDIILVNVLSHTNYYITVKYMSLLCKAILVAIKRGNENGAESEEDDQSDEVRLSDIAPMILFLHGYVILCVHQYINCRIN